MIQQRNIAVCDYFIHRYMWYLYGIYWFIVLLSQIPIQYPMRRMPHPGGVAFF